jgi:hypothetical protein
VLQNQNLNHEFFSKEENIHYHMEAYEGKEKLWVNYDEMKIKFYLCINFDLYKIQ